MNFRAFGITIARAAKYYIELNIDEFLLRVNPSVIDPSTLQSKTLRHFTITESKKKGNKKITIDIVKTKSPIPAHTLQGLFQDEVDRLKKISIDLSEDKQSIAKKITATYKIINDNISKVSEHKDKNAWQTVRVYIKECKEGLVVISNSNNYLYNLKEKVSSAIRSRNKQYCAALNMAPDYKKTNNFVKEYSDKKSQCLKIVNFNYYKMEYDDGKDAYVQSENCQNMCVYSESELSDI
jgi:hypothetical protein